MKCEKKREREDRKQSVNLMAHLCVEFKKKHN